MDNDMHKNSDNGRKQSNLNSEFSCGQVCFFTRLMLSFTLLMQHQPAVALNSCPIFLNHQLWLHLSSSCFLISSPTSMVAILETMMRVFLLYTIIWRTRIPPWWATLGHIHESHEVNISKSNLKNLSWFSDSFWVRHITFSTTLVCCVIVIVVGNEHGDTSSNPGRNSLHFT